MSREKTCYPPLPDSKAISEQSPCTRTSFDFLVEKIGL